MLGKGQIRACLVASLALQTTYVEGATRIVFHTLQSLVTARMDPLIAPGNVSQHVHHIVGGSNFDKVYDPKKLRASKCTNLGVQADKSNYWQPLVYRVLTNGSYLAMKTNTRIYYEQPATTGGAHVEAFPENFRMIAGNPSRKRVNTTDQGNILTFYYCENRDSSGNVRGEETYHLPTHSCSLLVAKTFFPTCWDGKPFSAKNPTAHVKYPLFGAGYLGANCPKGWPRRIPSILMETYYFNADKPASTNKYQYILANGDVTGYGLHADFSNGWDQTVLQKMLKTCKTVPVEEPANQACAALAPSYSESKAAVCAYQNTIPNEPVGYGKALKTLPGCNLPWSKGSKPTCKSVADPGWVKPPAGTLWP